MRESTTRVSTFADAVCGVHGGWDPEDPPGSTAKVEPGSRAVARYRSIASRCVSRGNQKGALSTHTVRKGANGAAGHSSTSAVRRLFPAEENLHLMTFSWTYWTQHPLCAGLVQASMNPPQVGAL